MIYGILKKEKVVCLCANCHSLIHSNIHLHFEELFNDDFFQNISSELYLEQFKEKYVKKYNKILKNINNFNYKDLDIISPLKSEFNLKNIWEIHFLEAFYFIQENQIDKFRIKNFIKSFKYQHEYAYEFVEKLVKKGYLKKVREDYYVNVKYGLTKKGREKISESIGKHKRMAKKIQNLAKIQNKAGIYENERTLSYEDVIKKYPFHIFEIILQNGYYEFTNIQLSKKVNRQARTISDNLKKKLIPEGIVEKVDVPLYNQIYQYNNVFKLTSKGYQLIKKYFKNTPTLIELEKINIEKIKNNSIRYSVFIYKLIQEKGFNEFIKKEILEITLTKRKDIVRYTGYLIRNSLMPEGIIEEVQEPQHISREVPATKIYKLSEKGIKTARKILEK